MSFIYLLLNCEDGGGEGKEGRMEEGETREEEREGALQIYGIKCTQLD
jgi:hypothetical protein